jgi:hypothetical protein
MRISLVLYFFNSYRLESGKSFDIFNPRISHDFRFAYLGDGGAHRAAGELAAHQLWYFGGLGMGPEHDAMLPTVCSKPGKIPLYYIEINHDRRRI